MTLGYLTSDLPGVGGAIKRFDEDFVVHEEPRYAASGVGTHTYFLIEKRGLPTLAALRMIARALGKNSRDIGYAGLKDAHGVTRQWLSVEHVAAERVWALNESSSPESGERPLGERSLDNCGGDEQRTFAQARACGSGEKGASARTEVRGSGEDAASARSGARVSDSHEPSRIRILEVTRHTNKIKLGHLAGNRFEIKIRGATNEKVPGATNETVRPAMNKKMRAESSESESRARAIMDVLQSRGVPNYFGPQRFGVRGDNAAVGLAVIRRNYDEAMTLMLGRPADEDSNAVRRARELFDEGDLQAAAQAWPRKLSSHSRVCMALHRTGNARKGWRAMDQSIRRLYLSAVQSELFNAVLGRRIAAIDKLQRGDLAWKHKNGACFLVEDDAAEQPRCDSLEISPTGPLFGRKMSDPAGEPARIEKRVLVDAGISRDELTSFDGFRLDGARRPLRVPLTEASLESGADEAGSYLLLRFHLPSGAYATNVTREVCKS